MSFLSLANAIFDTKHFLDIWLNISIFKIDQSAIS